MSSQIPPNPYFSGINYNPGFFSSITEYLTVAIANSKYLKLLGGTLSGFLGILRNPARVALDVNGKAVINDATSGIPVIATLGGAGTKLILKEGGGIDPPIALGTDTNDLWYGVAGGGNHRFYTGTGEKVRINNDGNVGIGTNNPQVSLDLYNDVNGGNSPYIKLRGGGGPNNSVGFILNPYYNRTALTTTKIYAIDDGAASANLCFATADSGTTTEAVERMRIKTNGNVGIGTNDPQSKLHLHTPTNATYVSLRMTDNTSGTGATDGIAIIKTDAQDMFLHVYENARMMFFTNNSVRMILSADGNLCIGNTAPTNILQVGSGQRLRISNSSTDYSQIGVLDTASANNTSIILSGHQRASQAGNIEYIAVNEHVFYSTNTGSYIDKIRIIPDDFQIKTSCTTYGANYYTDGEYLFAASRTNTAGQVKLGYFISNDSFYNSLIMLAVSHNDSTYSYWHGYYGTNNSSATLYIQNFNFSNMTVEAFQEQTTLKYFLYLRPTSTYNTSVQLRVKFYG